MKISDFLSPADVMIDARTPHKRGLLQELARKAATKVSLPADLIAAELLKREELGSTGTGGGIAIPHARMARVAKPFGMLLRLKHPIDFDAMDRQPIDLVFLLLLPADAKGDQLGVLASVARRLRSSETLAQLRSARSEAELYSAMSGE
jgi:PTS system nitrogen regulatory IIA component